MKTRTLLPGLFLFLAPVAYAAERSNDLSVLLADAPAEVLGVAYVQRPADLLNHPLLMQHLQATVLPALLEDYQVLAQLFDGPTAVTVTGSPLRPDLLTVTLTAKVSRDREAFFKTLDGELIAAWNRYEGLPGAGAVAFDRTGDMAVVRIPGPIPVQLTFALRDGYVRASTDRKLVEAWLAPPADPALEKPKTFLDSDDFKRLVPDAAQPPDLLAYVNLRTLVPLAKEHLRSDGCEIDVSALLGLDRVEALGLTAEWSRGRTAADLTACLAGEPSGLWKLFSSSGRAVNVAKVLPADAVALVGGTFENAAGLLDRVNELLDLVDPAIAREYQEERADFLRDFGFDIHADFLGNLAEEWAVAFRILDWGRFPEPVVAVRLRDPGAFDQQLRALTAAFDLKFDVTTYREVTVFKPLSTRFNVAYGVIGGYLVIGQDIAAICRAVDAWTDHKSLHEAPTYRPWLDRWTAGPSTFAYVNVSQILGGLALANGELWPNPVYGVDEALIQKLERLASADVSAALALSAAPERWRLSAELTGGAGTVIPVGQTLWSVAGTSLARERDLAKRSVSMSNLSAIARCALVYAQDHKGQWPASLSEMAQSGCLPLQALGNPYNGTAPRTLADADRESYYLYRKNIPKNVDDRDVVAGEREIRHGEGANFAFADGHVEFIREPEAGRLLATLQAQSR